MPFSTYNEDLTTEPNEYRWQPHNSHFNKIPSIRTTLPPLTAAEPQKRKCNNPSLSDRLAYVEALVDMNAMVIEAIWPTNTATSNIVPLRSFIQEVLKRSRTTYSTLQTAFFYLFRARPAIVQYLQNTSSSSTNTTTPLSGRDAYIHCGRRMFLASLVVASKFVQDKTYRNSVWAKIAGLPVQEINASERVFLGLLDYRLYVAQPTFDQWHQLLHAHVQAKTTSPKYGIAPGPLTDKNNSPLFQSSLPRTRSYPTLVNETSLPPLRPLGILQSSATTPSLSSLLSATNTCPLPALSPSSIASTSSSTCSPVLNQTPPILAATSGKRRLLHEHDLNPSLQYYRQQHQNKRPCT